MTEAELAAIDARLEAATPGPWAWDRWHNANGDSGLHIYAPRPGQSMDEIVGGTRPVRSVAVFDHGVIEEPTESDRDLIAHAPDDLRRLRAEVDRLRAQRDKLAHAIGVDLAELDGTP